MDHVHRCQPSGNRAGISEFWIISRIFARTSRISGFISKSKKMLKMAIISSVTVSGNCTEHFVRKSSAKTSMVAQCSVTLAIKLLFFIKKLYISA